ncbi:MAG: hypothetical protein QM296_11315 [Bacillota bacterium]|nr:hypothetical protein [Bacillota bacterium]
MKRAFRRLTPLLGLVLLVTSVLSLWAMRPYLAHAEEIENPRFELVRMTAEEDAKESYQIWFVPDLSETGAKGYQSLKYDLMVTDLLLETTDFSSALAVTKVSKPLGVGNENIIRVIWESDVEKPEEYLRQRTLMGQLTFLSPGGSDVEFVLYSAQGAQLESPTDEPQLVMLFDASVNVGESTPTSSTSTDDGSGTDLTTGDETTTSGGDETSSTGGEETTTADQETSTTTSEEPASENATTTTTEEETTTTLSEEETTTSGEPTTPTSADVTTTTSEEETTTSSEEEETTTKSEEETTTTEEETTTSEEETTTTEEEETTTTTEEETTTTEEETTTSSTPETTTTAPSTPPPTTTRPTTGTQAPPTTPAPTTPPPTTPTATAPPLPTIPPARPYITLMLRDEDPTERPYAVYHPDVLDVPAGFSAIEREAPEGLVEIWFSEYTRQTLLYAAAPNRQPIFHIYDTVNRRLYDYYPPFEAVFDGQRFTVIPIDGDVEVPETFVIRGLLVGGNPTSVLGSSTYPDVYILQLINAEGRRGVYTYRPNAPEGQRLTEGVTGFATPIPTTTAPPTTITSQAVTDGTVVQRLPDEQKNSGFLAALADAPLVLIAIIAFILVAVIVVAIILINRRQTRTAYVEDLRRSARYSASWDLEPPAAASSTSRPRGTVGKPGSDAAPDGRSSRDYRTDNRRRG